MAAAPSEAEFNRLWRATDLGSAEPIVAAAYGGALADRLAWVFLAGYQATIRRCFPDLAPIPGWSSFVNTEDNSGALPGTRLEGEPGSRRLNGWKTWVATARHVERLVVSSRHNEIPFIVVGRNDAGVIIDPGSPKEYLPEMSQGRVEFVDMPVAEAQIVGDEQTFPVFRSAEGAYVRTALSAFMLAHTLRLEGPPTLAAGALSALLAWKATLDLRLPSDAAAVASFGVANQVRALAEEFELLIEAKDPPLHQLWMRDHRLVGGAVTAMAARAAAVLGAAQPAE